VRVALTPLVVVSLASRSIHPSRIPGTRSGHPPTHPPLRWGLSRGLSFWGTLELENPFHGAIRLLERSLDPAQENRASPLLQRGGGGGGGID